MGSGGGWMLCGQSKFFSDLDFFKLDKTPKRMPEKSRSDVHVPKPISKMPCFFRDGKWQCKYVNLLELHLQLGS